MRAPASISVLLVLALASCSPPPSAPSTSLAESTPSVAQPPEPAVVSPYAEAEKQSGYQERLAITVHKTPSCGCCSLWTDHLRRNNFEVKVVDHDDLTPIKQRLGVPPSMASCHTGEIQGLFVEGHVPAGDIRRMLDAAPHAAAQIKGVAVPGMPAGSPGMEMGNRVDRFQVILVDELGEGLVFSEYGN